MLRGEREGLNKLERRKYLGTFLEGLMLKRDEEAEVEKRGTNERCVCMCVYECVCVNACVNVCMSVCVCTCVCACCVCMCVLCVCVCVCMCVLRVCACVCVCVWDWRHDCNGAVKRLR